MPPVFPVFLVGAVIGLGHLALSLQMSVTLSFHATLIRSLLLFLYPFGLAFLGVGAVLEPRLAKRFPRAGVPAWLRLGGASLLVFLAAAMRLNFFVRSSGGLAVSTLAHLIPLAIWFLCLGAVLAGVLREARERGSRSVGYAWALHLIGLLVGYGAADPLIYAVGVNAILFSIGASLLLFSRAAWIALPLLLGLAPLSGLDGRLESLRDIRVLMAGQPSRPSSDDPQGGRPPTGDGELAFFGWSRFAQIRIYVKRTGGGQTAKGYYSFHHQWQFRIKEKGSGPGSVKPYTTPLYSAVSPSDRAAIIGVGAGRTLGWFGFPLHKGITAVELDDAVVRFLRDERPGLNAGVFVRSDAVARDGRFVVATSPAPYDAVVVESARYHATNTSYPVGTPHTLYTREAVRLFWSKLKPGGLLMFVFNGMDRSLKREYFPGQVRAHLSREGVPHRTFAMESGDVLAVALVASRDRSRLDGVAARLAPFKGDVSSPWRPASAGDARHRNALTDRSPFSRWHMLDRVSRSSLLAAAGGFCLITLLGLGALLAARRSGLERGAWPAAPYFYLIGVGHVAVQIATVYAYRSYCGDQVTTAIRVLVHFLVYGTLGSLLAHRIVRRAPPRSLVLAVGAAVLAFHVGGLLWIPFQTSSALWRELYLAGALLPAGLLLGLFFPAGIMLSRAGVGRCLLADSLGTFCGYGLFYLLYLPFGANAYLAAGALAYAAAVSLYSPSWASGRRIVLRSPASISASGPGRTTDPPTGSGTPS